MKRILSAIILISLVMCSKPINLIGENVDEIKNYQYAISLAQRSNYKAASEEILRTIIHYPELRTNPDLIGTMLTWAEKTEDYNYAMQLNQYIANSTDNIEISYICQYNQGRILYRMKKYDDALKALTFQNHCPEQIRLEAAYISGLSLLRLRSWDKAEEKLLSIGYFEKHEEIKNKALTVARNGNQIKYRSPKISAFASGIIPGLGYIYCKSPRSGFASLITTGLFTWGAISAYDKEETGVGIILSIFSVGWYFGGIRGSKHAAIRYNEYLEEQVFGPLEIY